MSRYPRLAALLVQSLLANGVQAQEPVATAAPAVERSNDDPDVHTAYYDVRGVDQTSINASLAAIAPTRPDGSKASGLTTYEIRYSAVQTMKASQCTISDANLQMISTVHLPRLVDESSVPEKLLVAWKLFVEALRSHELGHVAIETNQLPVILTSIIGKNCDQLEAALAAGHARIDVLQRDYDRKTHDGATQRLASP